MTTLQARYRVEKNNQLAWIYNHGHNEQGYIRMYGEEAGKVRYRVDTDRLAALIKAKGHRINSRIAAWTVGYTPGTKSTDLVCGTPIVFVVGAKRMYWRHA